MLTGLLLLFGLLRLAGITRLYGGIRVRRVTRLGTRRQFHADRGVFLANFAHPGDNIVGGQRAISKHQRRLVTRKSGQRHVGHDDPAAILKHQHDIDIDDLGLERRIGHADNGFVGSIHCNDFGETIAIIPTGMVRIERFMHHRIRRADGISWRGRVSLSRFCARFCARNLDHVVPLGPAEHGLCGIIDDKGHKGKIGIVTYLPTTYATA